MTTDFAHYAEPGERPAQHGGATVVSIGDIATDGNTVIYLGVAADNGTYADALLTPLEATALAVHLIQMAAIARGEDSYDR